ncbi:uncharacterized protein LOC123679725 [Harmonia axyridis]|uniref:uncharacterized protein LOC123679725 n=1 Tax=Harmonia axyridis TaxID=115357 RepID=UPI001E27566E|nr:uncharacterized protein LOC123679725 [Harmonia axyridis]
MNPENNEDGVRSEEIVSNEPTREFPIDKEKEPNKPEDEEIIEHETAPDQETILSKSEHDVDSSKEEEIQMLSESSEDTKSFENRRNTLALGPNPSLRKGPQKGLAKGPNPNLRLK